MNWFYACPVLGRSTPTKPVPAPTKPTPGKSFLLCSYCLFCYMQLPLSNQKATCFSLQKEVFEYFSLMMFIKSNRYYFLFLFSFRTAIRNLVAVFPLDATSGARDISPTKNLPGKLSGVSIVPGPDRQPNTALRFSGSPSSYIEFPNNGRLDTRRSITVLTWLFNEGRGGPVFEYNPKGQGVGLRIKGANKLEARIISRRRTKNIPVTTPKKVFKPRTWTYVGFTYDYTSGIVTVYVNAKPVVKRVVGRVELLTNKPVRSGSKKRGIRFFRGRLSCIQVYSRALTVSEITTARTRCFKGGMVLLTDCYHFSRVQILRQ